MNSSARRTLAAGSFSEGLSTKVFPQAMAIGNIQSGTMAGKLKGVMPATTPRGWRTEKASMPVDTSSACSPLSRWGRPQANSITSRPRATSPLASDRTLPCWPVMSAASSSLWRSTRSRNRNRMRLRWASEVSRQPGKAALAEATAASTSSSEAMGRLPVCAPTAGSCSGSWRSGEPSVA